MIIRRTAFTEFGTFGIIIHNGIPFALTLERPWLNNERDVSCIPEGSYTCKRFHSSSHPDTFEVMGVQGRTGILFHKGNLMDHSAGCILIGEEFGVLNGKPAILSSKKGFNEFMANMDAKTEFELIIQNKGM